MNDKESNNKYNQTTWIIGDYKEYKLCVGEQSIT